MKEPKDFDFKEMAELVVAYGYKIVEIQKTQRKVRFKGEERDDLIFLWKGKKGVTMAIRNKETGWMVYKKWCTLIGVEDMINQYSKI